MDLNNCFSLSMHGDNKELHVMTACYRPLPSLYAILIRADIIKATKVAKNIVPKCSLKT